MIEIGTTIPINKTAAIVTGKGEHYKSQNKLGTHLHFRTRPRTIGIKKGMKDRTGQKKDRLLIIGLYEYKAKVYHKWVVRCDCGDYEIRTGKSLVKNCNDCCQYCKELEHMKRHSRQKEEKGSMSWEQFNAGAGI